MSAAKLATRMMKTKRMVRREFILPLAYLNFRIIFAQERRTAPWNPLLRSTAMTQHRPFRYVLFAVLGLIAGFLALAIAVPLEPQVIAPVIAVFSPGLKLVEFVTPESGKSFAWTFGWFLRIAILANVVFYFAILLLLGYFMCLSRFYRVDDVL